MKYPTRIEIQILTNARDILIERGWAKGQYARRGDGRSCAVNGDEPVCFCAVGAVYRYGDSFTWGGL